MVRSAAAPALADPPNAPASPSVSGGGHVTARRDDHPAPTAPPIRHDGTIFAHSSLMGTQVSMNVWLPPERSAAEAGIAVHLAFNEMARIETIMSEWQPDSELSRLNRMAGRAPVRISPELFEVLQRSREISELTEGKFDITFHSIGQLWNFSPASTPPDPAEIARHLPLVNYRHVTLDRTAMTARIASSGTMIGLGAIAKGYAVDRASTILRQHGFSDHVVEAGGDTFASGTKAGRPWMVGIQNPSGPGAIGAIPASNIAIVTSGDYQRFFEFRGRRYAHIIDPTTGYPVEEYKSAASVTLVADNAMDADAFATAVAVMGPDEGMAFVEAHPTLGAAIITHGGQTMVSSRLRSRFVAASAVEAQPASATTSQAR